VLKHRDNFASALPTEIPRMSYSCNLPPELSLCVSENVKLYAAPGDIRKQIVHPAII